MIVSSFVGDILVADEYGNLYFKDRTGDTFRWKGENVSTSEVEGVLSNLVNYKDVVVYGVEIKGQEGRAGMAAILDPDESLDFKQLIDGMKKSLPNYARPMFIRILKELDMTGKNDKILLKSRFKKKKIFVIILGTYKLKKTDLQKESFNPISTKDKLYYMDNNAGCYTLLTDESYSNILNGTIRL